VPLLEVGKISHNTGEDNVWDSWNVERVKGRANLVEKVGQKVLGKRYI